MTSLAATSIAGGRYWTTSINAVKLVATGFNIAFLVVYNPALLLEPGYTEWPLVMITVAMGLVCLVVSIHNHFFTKITPWQRVLYILATVCLFGYLFTHNYLPLFIGVPLFTGLMVLEWRKVRAQGAEASVGEPIR